MNKDYIILSEIETPFGYFIQVRMDNKGLYNVGYLRDDVFEVKHNNLSPTEVINALSFYAQSAFYQLQKNINNPKKIENSDFHI